MNSKILFLAALATGSFYACNSDNKGGSFFDPVSCSIPKKIESKEIIVKNAAIAPTKVEVENVERISSDGLLKVVSQEKKKKVFLGKKALTTNFELLATVVSFEKVNDGEYFLLTDESAEGAREEIINSKKAVHCKLVGDSLELIPMQIFADESQLAYDTADVYALQSINDFYQNEEEFFSEERDAASHYLFYNAREKSFLYKETYRDFNEDAQTQEYIEELGKFEYKNGKFYQVMGKQRKI